MNTFNPLFNFPLVQCLPQVSLRKCNRMPHYQLTSLSPAFFWWTIENNIVLICQCFATYFNSWRQFFWPHFWEFLSPSQTPAFFSYSVLHWNLVGSPNDMNLDAPQPISSKSVEEPDHCTMYMNRISKLVNSLCKPFVLDLCNFGSFSIVFAFGVFLSFDWLHCDNCLSKITLHDCENTPIPGQAFSALFFQHQ